MFLECTLRNIVYLLAVPLVLLIEDDLYYIDNKVQQSVSANGTSSEIIYSFS